MGDYGNQTSFEALPAQLPLELKASASLFPLLTDGILVDGDQTAGPAVAGEVNQARIALELKPHVSAAALADFCTRQDVTLLSVLNVAWAMVLAAYADTDVVHVLSVRYVAEVPHVGLSEITIDDGSTVRQNLVEVEKRLQASVAVPSATTVTDLQIWTSVDDHPAFNSVVLLSDGESPERVEVQAGNYIALQARAAQDQVAIHLQAPVHLLPEAQAKHCAATLSHVLGEIIQNPDRPLHAINLMSPSGLEQISHWNQTAPAVVSRCLHHIVDETAQARRDALAIAGADGQMTYAELQWYSDRLAQHLMQRGVGPETAVPLFFEKSKWAIVAMVAVVKAGGVIVNLDAKQPLPRLRGLLTQLQAQFVISSLQHATLWVDEYPVVVVSEDALAQLPTSEAVVPHLEVSPQNALYIIFTSGSTGTPKGVVVEHESFLTAAAQHVQAGQILPSSRVLQMTPYTFDVSMLEIFTTLTTGACICFCSDEEAARGITHIINFLQITWTFMTPSLVRLIDPEAVPTLKTLALGGEGLGRIDVTTWADKLQLINGYGPSECSVAATINTPLSLTSDPANIGVGYGANCWVVDPEDHHRLVPIGTVGELVIQGPIVARGYLHEPAKTAAVFLDETPDFAALLPQQPHAFRLYKTGDLVRQNSDGTFNFLGRKDRQVKLNGQRLELGEIEQRLSADALVRHALVMLPKEGPCQGRLVAVLSLHAFSHESPRDANVHVLSAEESRSARASLPKITARLATQLPVYMIPTFWVVLAALPFTTSGKVHGVAMTKWLAEMSEETYNEIAGVSDEGSETALSSEVELQLQQIWADELGIPVADLKANRSFIALGGDSLTAMKVVARCRKQQLVVSVPDVLRAANIVELAARTTKGSDTSSGDDDGDGSDKMTRSTPAGRVAALNDSLLTVAGLTSRDEVEDVYGCSPMQDGILLSQVKFPGTYQVRRVLRVQSTGDVPSVVDRLQSAWQTVVNRHPMLRTIFVDAEGQFRQLVLKEVPASVQVCERRDLTEEQAVVQFLQDQPMPSYGPSDPQHHFTICHAAGDAIFLKFEISHALVDGASNEVILRELSQAFDVQDFPSPAALFGDYIEYISEAQAGSNNSLSHWTTYLAGVQPTIVPMYPPTEQQHGPKQIRSVPVPVTENQVAALVRLSEANGITLANVLQTAWALTLRAYTGFDDVCFGYIASGRDVPVAGIEHAVGAFINMLVCRVRLDQYPSVLEAAAGMQAEYFDALPHQHTSLAQIQNALKLSGMPLFNSIVSVQKEVTDQLLAEWSLSFQPLTEDDPTDFDLTVHIYMGKERAHLSIGYWSSLLSEGDAANLANTFSGAIDCILTQANSSASDLDLFTERDREQIFAWNQDEPVAAPGVVHEYIHSRARQQPDAPAVCAWDGEYTYAELDQLSEKLAHHLAQLGAGPEVLIPHCFDKSRLAPVTMLAIMKSGSAGVGLSAAHPQSRIQDIVENCAARIAVVAPQHVSVVEGLVEHIVVLDEAFLTSLPAPTAGAQLPQAKPCNPAFVSFTSGSTGKPKGIVLEHGCLITSILAHGVEWEVNQSARVLQFSAYAFDASVSDTFTTLVGGGTICIPQEKERVDDLAGAINRLGVTWAFLTPRVLGLLSPEAVPTLKTVVLGGEAISREDISRWTEALSIRIVYGPTECTIYSMGTEPLTADSDPANLGHAVGTRLWVTDPENTDRLLPVGCIGELIIEGPLVTRGYLNEPEKTKAAYLEDPVWLPKRASGEPRRFYKTSDLVRYYPNGDLRFIGRKDTQIKVRGQRVELGEIEHAILETMPGAVHITVDAVVLPPQTLVAFLYLGGHSDELMMPLNPEVTAQLRTLEKSLSETLPSYMVPSLFIPISHIPMTISGKVDRIVLRRAVSTLSSAQLEMYALAEQIKAAPQTPQEIQLQKLWAKVLRKEASTVGRDDSFFRLGGNSIGAMKLVAAARGAGLVLSVADIFRHPQLSDMAAQLVLPEGDSSSSSSSSSPSSSTSPLAYTPFSLLPAASTTERENLLAEAAQQCSISLEAIEDVYPATPLQEGVFLMSTTHKGAYVAPTAFRISADFDLARFKAAWQTLVDAHSILRTRLVTVESTSYQVVLTKDASQLQWEHAASCDGYLARTQSLSVVPGDPLTRYALIPAEDHSTIFVWTAHHAVFDGWSVGLLFEQLVQLYKQQDGLALATPTGPSYAEFVQFLETKTDADASRKFWASLVPSEPPAIFPRLPAATYQPTAKATCFRTISNIVQPEQSNLTLAILLRAAWAIVLARYTDAEDILYGLTLSGRDVPVAGVERMVGPTITTVPMNVHLDGEMLVETFLQQQQDQNIEMMRHQHAGLQAIRRISPAASAASDFTNLFVVQPHTNEAPGLEQMVQVTTDMSRFDPYALVLECNMKANGQVLLEARFDDVVVSSDQTQRLLGHFEHVLQQLTTPSTPDRRLKQVDMFSPEDERQIWAWNAEPAKPENVCVHQLVTAAAKRHPNHVAVDAWDGSLTYWQLDDMSSRLADWLISSHALKPESLVPLCFDKSLWTIVTMMAVVKCGGGCVMLNPEHPISRLEGVIADTGSSVVLAAPDRASLFASVAGVTVVAIDESLIRNLPVLDETVRPLPVIKPTNPVFVIFTSGSTGKPKGIVVQHNGVCTVAIQHGEGLGFTGKNLRVLQFASFSFDVSMGEVFITLMKGGTLCIPTEDDRINNLAATINLMNITWTFMAPTVAALLDPREVPNLQTLVLGGEAVSQSLVDQWSNQLQLIDSYGPAECTIWASHANASATVSPANIGRGVGCRYWVADIHDHNRLAPVGCVGELLIEGPNVSRGYLNEAEKTRDAFIESPAWMQGRADAEYPYKFYKTGDLVRYMADGSLEIAGRKDSQVKFHGQRIELGEIEFHLRASAAVEAGMVTLPKAGLCKGKLVAIVALTSLQPEAAEGDRVQLVLPQILQSPKTQSQIQEIQEELGAVLPPYMVPTIWVVLDSIPLTASRKINRVPISRWVMDMSEETYHQVVDATSSESDEQNLPSTALEKQLAQVWSHVLNLPLEAIGLHRSFLSLGGDSITAMQVVARCRSQGIDLSVQDILQPKSLAGVVARAHAAKPRSAVTREEVYDVPFELSPIQQLYFEAVVPANERQQHHYNQSVLLRVTHPILSSQLTAAIEKIVNCHAMLRARFHQDVDGKWTQLVRRPASGLAPVSVHDVTSREAMLEVINASQRQIDIEQGPVFVVDYFTFPDSQGQLLSLIAHHLVVDAVSWHILVGQLEQLLLAPSEEFQLQCQMPFQSWAHAQREYAEGLTAPSLGPHALPTPNLSYWGLKRLPSWKDGAELTFNLDTSTTALLLVEANTSLRTQPVDLLVAALQQSFTESFPDRAMPAIFSEGHGREPWDTSIDLSETVGWFTVFQPIHRHVRQHESVKETVKRTKDARRACPDHGFAYFTGRQLRPAASERHDMEICFNYLGQAQHTERADAFLQEEPLRAGEVIDNIGEAMGRLAVFDVSAAVSHGRLLDRIRHWAESCQKVLQTAVTELAHSALEYSLSDFPLMAIDYADLSTLTSTVLPGIGLASDAVEDLYPCSSIQDGILISQARQPGTYEVRQLFEIVPRSDVGPVNVSHLLQAWQRIVDRHTILRTVFIESLTGAGVYDQLVLRSHQPNVLQLVYEGVEDYPPNKTVYCQLELSHALIDGTSMALLVRDLISGYENTLPATPAPLYHDYMAYLASRPEDEALAYWTDRLAEILPCHFPDLQPALSSKEAFESHTIHIDREGRLQRNLFQAAWGLVLRAYTGHPEVCFGYMASGRDIPMAGIEEAVGPFINLLVCKLDVSDAVEVQELLQTTSLAKIQHALGNHDPPQGPPPQLEFRIVDQVDPTEYDVDLNITTGDAAGVEVHLTYRTTMLSQIQANNLLQTFTNILLALTASPDRRLSNLEIASTEENQPSRAIEQAWSTAVEASVPELIAIHASKQPTAVAVQSADSQVTLTYQDLDRRACALAGHLSTRGVGLGDVVPLVFDRDSWALVAMLAVLQAGAIALPLDLSVSNIQSLRDRLSAAKCSVMLCGAAKHAALFDNESAFTPVIVDSTTIQKWDESAKSDKLDYPSAAAIAVAVKDGTDWALLTHCAISTVATQLGPVAGLGPAARVLQFNPATSPFYLVETLYSLVAGSTVVIPAAGDVGFAEAVRDSQANWALTTPTVAALTNQTQVPSLKTLMVAGEEFGPALCAQWNGVNLIHPHGLIDSSVWLSFMGAAAGSDTLVHLAAPAVARIWVANPFNGAAALTPVDCVGPVLVDGPVVPRCHLLSKAQETSSTDKVTWSPGTTVYHTGQVGRRIFEQENISLVSPLQAINGHATNLTALEQQVQVGLPVTQHAVLSIMRHRSTDKVAVFVIDRSSTPQTSSTSSTRLLPGSESQQQLFSELKSSLRAAQLPEPLLPSLFFPLDNLPLTHDYKVDREALQQLTSTLSELELQAYSLAPVAAKASRLTANEQLLADLWVEVLHLPDPQGVDPSDSFFRLGGDSIGAMRLVANARSQGLSLTMNTIFQQPTLSGMAKELRVLAPHEDRPLEPFSLLPTDVDVERLVAEAAQQCQIEDSKSIEDIYPCTPLQEGLMVLTSQDHTAYVVQEVFSLPGNVDLSRFQAAWEAVVARSTILRTRIINTPEGAFQVLLPEKGIAWESGADLSAYLARDSAQSMSYGQPLARYAILTTPGQNRYFVWTAHHAVYDGLTLPILAKQVSAEYNQEIALPEVPYNRFIDYIQGISSAAATEFWTTQCATPATTFPVLPGRSFQPTPDQTQHHSVSLTRSPSDITLPTVLRAAWAVVLAQRTESEHVSFGLTLSGRNAALAGINQVLGPTIATVPVQIQVRENQSPWHFLRAVQQQAIDMIPFEHTGLQNIRRMGDAAREAVDFQNLLLIQPASAPMDGSDFLGLTPVAVEKEQSDPYPLTVECNLLESGVEIKAQFDSRLISPAEMRSILQQYARTIERFNAVPEATDDENDEEEKTLDSMGTLSPEDLQQTLAWNANRPPYVNSCVHEQFEEQVRLRPDALAVSSFDVELTYRQLNVLVDSLATELLARGVRSEMKIPLCFTKCSWTIVAMFAVMKVGGVSCMFNPEHPSSRIQLLLDDLDARLVLCDPESAQMLSTLLPSEGVLPVDGDYLRSLPPATPLLLEGLVHPTNAVFVVYTSGSTGKPKGSILEHRSLVTGLLAHAGAMGIGPGTRTFQFAAYTFDVCFEEIIGSLMLGACICVPSEAERMNALADAMAKYRVTWTELTPTVASLLLPSSIPTLQTLALSGESLTQDVIQRWAGAVQIINTYGPSECCVSTTCNLHTATLRDPSNIGRGLGCTTWIVDPDNVDRLVPIGAVGELLVEGPIVARGYLNEPEKTAAAFISAPVWWPTDSYPSERIYRTGDLVKYNPDGTIKFIGRKDTQVKLHGQRIELGEIEHRLRAACADGDESSSHQVAVEVLTPKSRGGIKILTAFICESDAVADDNEEGHFLLPLEDEEGGRPRRFCDLQARLLAVLPRHMVPQLFIPVSHMPLSPSRKLERKRLRAVGNGLTPEQLASYALTQVAKTAPSTATETALADIWARVLGTSRSTIGVQDNFFHLGGDSIAAMKAVAAATKAGLPPLSVADITQSPTLSAMAASMDHASVLAQQAGGETAVPVGPAPFSLLSPEEVSAVLVQASTQCAVAIDAIEDIYPCTPSQEALMALTARDDTAYVSRSVYRLPLHLDLEKYRQAWELLAQRQAILRTRIVYSEDARSFQVVVREPLVWQELSADSVTAYVTRDQRLSMRHGQPLMRFALLAAETGDDSRPVLVHTAHHAVYDGWSEASMFAEAEAIYRHGLSSLPPVTPYNQFIHYLTTTVDPAACEAFWRTQLDGDLPALFPAPFPAVTASAATPRPNRSLSYRIDLTRTPSTPYSTPTILKAAWSLLLARYTTSNDVLFGHVLSGRTVPLPGVAEMMGPTIATVPVRVQLSRDESIDAFLRRLRDQAQAMAPFEQIGLQRLRRLAAEPIDLGHLFFIQPRLDSSDEGLGLEPVTATDYEFETYPLIVECQLGATTDDDKLIVEVKYDDTRIAPTQMSWLLQHFETLVHQLCERPSSTPLSDLTLTGSANLLQLQQWMGSPVAPLATTLHEQFRAQAQAHPDRVAIAGWDGSLTYRELEEFSTRFARDLVALNLRPGTPVGVVFDKSCWAIVALLTVLTAGGACIHLDPQHPMTRLTEIVADTGLQHILAAPQYASHPVQRLPVRHVLVVDATTARKRASRSLAAASLPRLPVVEPTSPAYMTFTSGSTGKPKTVVIDHRAICTSIDAFTSALHLKAGSRVLQFAAYTFDISYAEIFAPLLLGGTVCVLSNADRLNDLAGAMKRLGVNWACLTPTVASLVQPAEVASLLQTLVLSGEAPTEENLRNWAGQVPNLINAYGPSEASVWCAAGPFTRPDDSCTDIGVPVGCRLWIAEPDNLHRLTPLGCVGELLVEGPIMAQGYLNNAPATRAAFLSDLAWMKEVQPQPLPGFNRVYRTGDLARYLPGGRIQYLGRADTQIKVYGRRIEPREIEHHIRTHLPDTHTMVDSVTLVNRGNQKVLVAYLFQESGPMPDMELAVLARPLTPALQETLLSLQAALRARLPHYMLPALFVPLQLLPTSAAGKTDRTLLGRVVNAMSESQRESYALQSLSRAAKRPLTSALERQLADLWATALGIDVTSIGADDSFFGLGGDSMVAMKVASLARAAQLSLTVADLFNHPVLASLAAQLSTAAFQDVSIATQDGARTLTTNPVLDLALAAALAPQVGVDVSSIAAIATTTAFQDHALVGHLTESRWMLNFFYFDGSSPSLGSSKTELAQRLRRGCGVLVQQFDILRTVFASHAGRFWQVVLHQLTPQFRVETTSDLDTFTKQLYADGLKAKNFRLSEPFVQFVLAVQPDGKHRLLMRLSHAQYDGVSLPTLWDALQRACQGENASFLPPAPSFQEFLHAGSPSSAATLAHWKSFLSGAPETRFVTYRKPALHDASRAQVLQVTRRCIPLVSMHDRGITPATVIKAAWAVLLARLAGSTDVTFGHTVANRSNSPLPGVDKVVGPCLNVVPIRARLHAGQTVLELLQALQQQQIANMPHESMGFREIIRDATHWPHWTHFSSVVQHQNIDAVDDTAPVLLGDAADFTAYTPGFLGAELDLVDVSVLSTPVPAARGTTVVNLDLVTSTAVMAPFAAELLLDQLVSLLRSWAAWPVETMLAYAAGDESLPALLPLAAYTDDGVEIEVPSTSDDLTKSRVVQEAVQRAWRSVLPGVDAVDDLTHDLDFFAAGGDLVQMAQLLTLLQADDELKAARGVRLEALVKCSSREKMVRLLL
ncbi:acetyl-CoA synthetase-like protein [Aspergillus violaceofuscus CBS 115571]|uniref:Acetyl-CoA synthetase-like protein n=1 Tax=Aspergillus violaceofuscus (strain CBS 115571) TaxID=1450538 RepID=A0A2V5HG91_ASPV1|nr:acetyl-CoA synthetase-like protein [Aspergillus violaceofuscus CBS 115571]